MGHFGKFHPFPLPDPPDNIVIWRTRICFSSNFCMYISFFILFSRIPPQGKVARRGNSYHIWFFTWWWSLHYVSGPFIALKYLRFAEKWNFVINNIGWNVDENFSFVNFVLRRVGFGIRTKYIFPTIHILRNYFLLE